MPLEFLIISKVQFFCLKGQSEKKEKKRPKTKCLSTFFYTDLVDIYTYL